MYILGISCFYHDSAAALIKNNNIIAAVQEERFTRKKHDSSFPINSIKYCLEESGIDINQIDEIIYYDHSDLTLDRIISTASEVYPKGLKTWMSSLLSFSSSKSKNYLKNILI